MYNYAEDNKIGILQGYTITSVLNGNFKEANPDGHSLLYNR